METLPLALVHVRGRRVSWSSDPHWFPRDRARGEAYSRARARGRAGQSKERADRIVRALLESGAVRGVLVTGEGLRAAYVTRPAVGGTIRTAWSDSPEWWPTLDKDARFNAAREAGRAGVVYGEHALREALAGGIVPLRNWRAEVAAAEARRETKVPSLEEQAWARYAA